MKPARQSLILEIITERDIETQNDLMEALAERGVKSTQATLSRDIKDMHLLKKQGANGKYVYVSPEINESNAMKVRLGNIFREGVLSYAVAQNILVIKTLPGLAPAACSAIDNLDLQGLVGSIAGDDTVFLAMKDTAAAINLHKEIDNIL